MFENETNDFNAEEVESTHDIANVDDGQDVDEQPQGQQANVEAETAAVENTVPQQEAYTPPQQAQPQGDPVLTELEPYKNQLLHLVETGEISMADAQLRYDEQITVKRTLLELQNNLSMVTGANMAGKTREVLQGCGVQSGSDLEKEVVGLMKKDWGVDINNPLSFSRVNDESSIRFLVDYVIPKAERDLARRTGSKPKTPVVQGASQAFRESPVDTKPVKKFGSFKELTQAENNGLI